MDAIVISTKISAMQQVRRASTHISLAITLPALLILPWPRFYCSSLLHRIPLCNLKPSNARTIVAAGKTVAEQKVTALPTRLVCRQQLQYGQHSRNLLVSGAGAQDGYAITLLKSPCPILPSYSVFSSSHGRNSGQMRCSSYSPAWKISAPIASTSVHSVDTKTIEQVWELYFADASQWWDNRVDKKNPKSPDFKHKLTGRALWIDGWSTPAWVKARLKSVTQSRLQRLAGYGARDYQGTVQGVRPPKCNNGKETAVPINARELRQIVPGDSGSMHLQGASTTSEAIAILKNRRKQGINIDPYMYVEVLKRCLKQNDLTAAKQVHECIIKSGMDQNTYVGNFLLRAYIKCGSLQDARRVFHGLVKKDTFSWNIMIAGYAQRNDTKNAIEIFHQLRQGNVQANEITYMSILKACSSPLTLKWGKEIHAHIKNNGFELDVRVGTALLKMYAKCGAMKEARQAFEKLTNRNVITWNVMIGAYAESGCGEEAYRLLLKMKREGFQPDAITFTSILNACACAGALEWVKEVHRHVLEAGYESDLRLGNALVHMYAKSGSIDDARQVFDRMEGRDVITWNVMIGAYAKNGCGEEAYRLFLQMKLEGFKPDAITYASILNACASAAALEWVKEVHRHVLDVGLESDLRVGTALVHMYAKSGSIDDARLVFDRMEDRDVVIWSIMVGGLAQHGFGLEALEMFRKMNAEGVIPNGYSFVAVLSACSHTGLVDEGRKLFLAMSQDYGIEPTVVHFTCMVDLLGRAGLLEEAKLFIDNMPVEANEATWGALLSACRSYGNVEMGELAAKELLKLQPENASTYVALSNIYAAAGKWEERLIVRTMMEERGIRKEPGRSWIEVDNKIHYFVVGDTSHPESKEIYAELNRITERIKGEGYVPDTQLVLESIDEEEKEVSLCSHSEKLAIAYGLMRTPHGKPIRVHKNLRVCSDCHTATKFITKVTGREIVARDANRFHYFKDGMCSCGDYW